MAEEALREAGNVLAEIVRGYGGVNSLVLLTPDQITWLGGLLSVYPASHEMAGGIHAELERAGRKPLPKFEHLPSNEQAVIDWEEAAG